MRGRIDQDRKNFTMKMPIGGCPKKIRCVALSLGLLMLNIQIRKRRTDGQDKTA